MMMMMRRGYPWNGITVLGLQENWATRPRKKFDDIFSISIQYTCCFKFNDNAFLLVLLVFFFALSMRGCRFVGRPSG